MTPDWEAETRRRAEALNEEAGTLTGYDCPLCKNRGVIWEARGLECVSVPCSCVQVRRNMRYLRESGLANLAERYTFKAWKCIEPWQRQVLDMARRFADDPQGWFFLAGRPGTGKTHLCTAICCELMRRGYPARYLLWRDFTAQIKSAVTDEERYQELISPLKRVRVLYIDDLFKGGGAPTVGDINVAFELLNARYNDPQKITIISSERTINEILRIDEGVGSRIRERMGNYYADLTGRQNYRLRATSRREG